MCRSSSIICQWRKTFGNVRPTIRGYSCMNLREVSIPTPRITHEQPLISDLGKPSSLENIFSKEAPTAATMLPLSSFSRYIVLVTLYEEERKFMGSSRSWMFSRAMTTTLNRPRSNGQLIDGHLEPEGTRSPRVGFQNLFDVEFATFRPSTEVLRPHSVAATESKFYHIFSIARSFRLRSLYAFSRWQATEAETKAAGQEILVRMQRDPARARRCVLHAGAVFGSIRSDNHNAHFDPFCLLVATLYLWAYQQLVVDDLKAPSSSPALTSKETLRIDKWLDTQTANSWVNEDAQFQIHLTGVGVIQGLDGSVRLLKESIRILTHQLKWSVLGRGIAQGMKSILPHASSA